MMVVGGNTGDDDVCARESNSLGTFTHRLGGRVNMRVRTTNEYFFLL
jgi:hypothetical protein